MIVDVVRGDVLKSSFKHIAFAINADGANDAGFAGLVAKRFWPGLERLPPSRLGGYGGVFYHESGGHRFCAMVCHSLAPDGWKDTPKHIEKCFETLLAGDVPRDEVIACVLAGAGPVGQAMGADPLLNMGAMARSPRRVVVFTL